MTAAGEDLRILDLAYMHTYLDRAHSGSELGQVLAEQYIPRPELTGPIEEAIDSLASGSEAEAHEGDAYEDVSKRTFVLGSELPGFGTTTLARHVQAYANERAVRSVYIDSGFVEGDVIGNVTDAMTQAGFDYDPATSGVIIIDTGSNADMGWALCDRVEATFRYWPDQEGENHNLFNQIEYPNIKFVVVGVAAQQYPWVEYDMYSEPNCDSRVVPPLSLTETFELLHRVDANITQEEAAAIYYRSAGIPAVARTIAQQGIAHANSVVFSYLEGALSDYGIENDQAAAFQGLQRAAVIGGFDDFDLAYEVTDEGKILLPWHSVGDHSDEHRRSGKADELRVISEAIATTRESREMAQLLRDGAMATHNVPRQIDYSTLRPEIQQLVYACLVAQSPEWLRLAHEGWAEFFDMYSGDPSLTYAEIAQLHGQGLADNAQRYRDKATTQRRLADALASLVPTQ